MKKVAILFILALLCGCNGVSSKLVPCSDTDLTCAELVTETVLFSDLEHATKTKKSIESLNKLMPVQCLRKQGTSYQAVYRTDAGWALVSFDSERLFQGISEVQISGTLEASDFEIIKIGTKVAEVKELDPSGDYTFMYASWSNYPQCSYHYTRDGYEIAIFYDSSFSVSEILISKI